ncbi:hypothetical protein [Hydrogenophaga sp. T2]|uniref:hypothetical protein n=1 Tax=Hydrogenophaga sp. T2 TaxID=3132823 RepID=UPI003CE7B39C
MNPPATRSPTWATTSSCEPSESLPMELEGLGEHIHQCTALFRPWQTLLSAARSMRGAVAARAITVICVIAAAGAIGWVFI